MCWYLIFCEWLLKVFELCVNTCFSETWYHSTYEDMFFLLINILNLFSCQIRISIFYYLYAFLRRERCSIAYGAMLLVGIIFHLKRFMFVQGTTILSNPKEHCLHLQKLEKIYHKLFDISTWIYVLFPTCFLLVCVCSLSLFYVNSKIIHRVERVFHGFSWLHILLSMCLAQTR